MKNFKLFIATLVLTVFSVNVWGETYTKATSLKAGDEIVLVCEAKSMELTDISTTSTKYGIGTEYTSSPAATYAFEVVAGSETNSFSFKTGSNYLRWNSGNSLDVVATSVAKNSSWLVTFDADGNATIKNANDETRVIWWNVSSPRFACYTDKSDGNDYKYVQLYKKAPSCTDPTTPLSITIAATVKTGKTISLSSTGGNGGSVEWSVTNGIGSATIANGILTAGNVGTVTVKAHQDQNGTTCETDAEQTVTISAITYTDYITECSDKATIRFDMQGHGTAPATLTEQELDIEITSLPSVSNVEGYTFLGWSETANGNIITSFTPTQARTYTLYAIWETKTFMVHFFNNGEEWTEQATSIQEGQSLGTLPTLTSGDACDQTSTTFIGWMIGDISGKSETPSVMVDETTKITEDINLNAVWAEHTGAQTAITPSATFSNYYANISGKSGDELRTTLGTIISTDYSEVSYDNLRYLLKYADTENANGTDLIDIYSPCTFTISGEIAWSGSCSGATNVGCGLNREHTVPQSWFSEQSPMVSDAFHIYAVDAASNGHRSNYFYGECTSGTSYTGDNCNEAGKLGSSSRQDYTGTVYEPADEYKGDIARGFFYMATRYAAQCSSWNNMFGNNKGLTDYTVALMLDWHRQDPVSEKELIRNEVIYGNSTYNPSAYKQNNRNPFIDYPELVEHIWGNQSATPVNLTSLSSAYENSGYTGYMTHCTYTIEVNEQPVDVICYQDDNASLIFSVSLVGGTGSLSYQWQSSANGTDGWTDIANATSPTYKPSTNAIGVTHYRCVVTSEKATPVASNVVAVTVNQKLSNKYTITYAYQGWSTDAGSQVLEVDGGSTVILPTLTSLGMTQEGYNFVKWEMNNGTQQNPGYEFNMPTENIVISAVLEEIQQTVSYTINGSAYDKLSWTSQPITVNYWDNDLTAEYTITDGYHVSAAAVTVNGVALTAETEFLFDDKTITIMPSAKKFAGAVSITLTIEPMVYTVYLSALDATNTYTSQVEATFGQDMPAIATLPIRPGYTFLGYSYTDQETSITTQYYSNTGASAHAWDIPAGATLTAQWSTVSYGITYTETTNLTWGEKPANVTVETDMLTANYTVTAGYEVTGMTVTVGGNAIAADDIDYTQTKVDIMTTFSGAVVITPIVTPIHYTITYLKNDGSATSSTQVAVYMENVTLKNGTAFNRKGYTIDHWSTEDETVTYAKGYTFEPYNLTSDLTLKAIWAVKADDWYTITFVDQLQDSEVEPIRGILSIDGFTFPTLADRETPPDDTGQCNVQHYHFMGWIAESDKDNEITESNIIKGGTEVSAASVTANATYYAIWATATMD